MCIIFPESNMMGCSIGKFVYLLSCWSKSITLEMHWKMDYVEEGMKHGDNFISIVLNALKNE